MAYMDSSLPPPIRIFPPLLNTANPWATTLEDLKTLWECSSTGAVTTRTSLLKGFPHDDTVHQYTFFDPSRHDFPPPPAAAAAAAAATSGGSPSAGETRRYNASLNTLGYSPITLDEYLGYINSISSTSSPLSGADPSMAKTKYFIVSVTGTPDEVAECYRRVARLQQQLKAKSGGGGSAVAPSLAVEVNLSCPNIPGKPPPAYSGEALAPYLVAIRDAAAAESTAAVAVPWGLKTPPYTYTDQFETLIKALREAAITGTTEDSASEESKERKRAYSPVSFLTATNTLGSSLVLDGTPNNKPKLPGGGAIPGIGGLAGAPLHPLALGNVATLRRLLDAHPETQHVSIIGVGGVEDATGYRRMRSVGAEAVGVATALVRKGVGVFGDIEVKVKEGGGW